MLNKRWVSKRLKIELIVLIIVSVIAIFFAWWIRFSYINRAAVPYPYISSSPGKSASTCVSPSPPADGGEMCGLCIGKGNLSQVCSPTNDALNDLLLQAKAAGKAADEIIEPHFNLQSHNLGYSDTPTMFSAMAMALDTQSTIGFSTFTDAEEIQNPITIALIHARDTGLITQDQYEGMMKDQITWGLEIIDTTAVKYKLSDAAVKTIKLAITYIGLRNFINNLQLPGMNRFTMYSPPLDICQCLGGSLSLKFAVNDVGRYVSWTIDY